VTCQSLSTNPSPLLAALAREYAAWTATAPRRQRRPSLATVAKQARKAGIEVAGYEYRPDGTIVVVTGKPQTDNTDPNPWDEVNAANSKRPS
jgi:hypothetical protein